MATATKGQLAKIHVLLNSLGAIDQKALMVNSITNGRTESTKELTVTEAREMIINLAQYDPSERLKSLIFSLAYRAGIIYGDTPDDKKMNAAKLNAFLRERGAVKLSLNDMRYNDLKKVHRQFEAIVKNTAAASERKQASAAVNNLLNELNLTTN